MQLITEPYVNQVARWPPTGRHVLAQFNDQAVVVYQAYRPAIGHFAASNGYFGGQFSLERMSWIKPNFLWMMHRCSWGTKAGQEVILAVWLKREAFDSLLAQAVPSIFEPAIYRTEAEWQAAVKQSALRLQWDPDHTPSGGKVARRALQLGLRGTVLARYAREWILDIQDISDFVGEQRVYANAPPYTHLITPRESVYPIAAQQVAARLGVPAAAGE